MNKRGVCLILSAPSGGGKTTLIRALEKKFPEMHHSISYTTREPRHDGADIHDYHFITPSEFENLVENGEFLEWAEVHGNLYGTRRKDLIALLAKGYDVVLDIDVKGSRQIQENFDEGVHVFIMPPSLKVLEYRLRNRKTDSESVIQKRLKNARIEMKQYKAYEYVILNDHLDDAIDRLIAILLAERCKAARIALEETQLFFE